MKNQKLNGMLVYNAILLVTNKDTADLFLAEIKDYSLRFSVSATLDFKSACKETLPSKFLQCVFPWDDTCDGRAFWKEVQDELVNTKKQEHYVTKHFNTCPSCKSTQIEGHEVCIEGNAAYQDISCMDCDSTWTDKYILSGYFDLSEVK